MLVPKSPCIIDLQLLSSKYFSLHIARPEDNGLADQYLLGFSAISINQLLVSILSFR